MPGAYIGEEEALTCYLGNEEVGLSYIGVEEACHNPCEGRTVLAPDGSIWGVTCNTYATDNEAAMRQGIRNEFGATAIPLDWNDMEDYYNTYGNMDILLNIPPYTNDFYGGCTLGGNYTQSGSRKYYVNAEGKLENPGFGQFGIIGEGEGPNGGNILDLGSWYGTKVHYIKIPAL